MNVCQIIHYVSFERLQIKPLELGNLLVEVWQCFKTKSYIYLSLLNASPYVTLFRVYNKLPIINLVNNDDFRISKKKKLGKQILLIQRSS